MNTDRLKLIGIDTDKGLRFFGYDEDMYKKYLIDFCEEKYIEEAIEEMGKDNISGAFTAMHKLKALVEYISIPKIDGMVHEVTETLRAGKKDGVIDGLMYLKTVVDDIRQGLNEEFADNGVN